MSRRPVDVAKERQTLSKFIEEKRKEYEEHSGKAVALRREIKSLNERQHRTSEESERLIRANLELENAELFGGMAREAAQSYKAELDNLKE